MGGSGIKRVNELIQKGIKVGRFGNLNTRWCECVLLFAFYFACNNEMERYEAAMKSMVRSTKGKGEVNDTNKYERRVEG